MDYPRKMRISSKEHENNVEDIYQALRSNKINHIEYNPGLTTHNQRLKFKATIQKQMSQSDPHYIDVHTEFDETVKNTL